jgi:hypothetical protein
MPDDVKEMCLHIAEDYQSTDVQFKNRVTPTATGESRITINPLGVTH